MFELLPHEKSYLLKAALITLGLLSLFLLSKTISEVKGYSFIGGNGELQTIDITTTGEAYSKADIATISFTIDNKAPLVADAQTKTTETSNKAIDILKKKYKIAAEDIKTTNYGVNPEYSYPTPCYGGMCPRSDSPKIIGYDVSTSIEVKVRTIDDAGAILKSLGDIGITQIYGPNFSVDDEDAAKNEARTEAIRKASEQARVIERALGVSLGKPISFSEDFGGGYPIPMYAKGGVAMETSVATVPAPSLEPGQNKVTVTVHVSYRIR